MDLGTVFKLSLYGLTALVGAILGDAEGEGSVKATLRDEFVLPFLSLPLVVCGYLLTERGRSGTSSRSWGLSSLWANLLGIVALIATAYEFFSENREGKLLAGTHLLLYATWIVLFQQKTIRLYWFLMALGILQLAVASVLTTKGWFGLCAVAYMFGAVWTLSIFSLWRAEQLFAEEDQLRLAESLASQGDASFSSAPAILQKSEVRSAVQHEDGTRWLTVRFVTGVLMTTCSALLVSTAFFIFIPRMWVGPDISLQDDQDPMSGSMRKTRLSTSVRLGDLGSVLESVEPVFDIRLINVKTTRTVSAQEYAEQLGLAEPLFRGTILTRYSKGRWSADIATGFAITPFERSRPHYGLRQEVRMEPNSTEILFCLGQPFAITNAKRDPYGEMNEITGVASRSTSRNDTGTFEYNAFTLIPNRQYSNHKIEVSPAIRELYRTLHYLRENRKLPAELTSLAELAHRVVEKESLARQKAEGLETPRALSALEVATAMESHLRDSGQYHYSLDLSIVDSKIDPVEDFLFNRKAGHCEYFATALALMLRAEKIPARIVSGYKGGVPHPHRKDTLEIQQRFAHLWVEAWVDEGGWTTFDATPADARAQSIASVTGKKPSIWAGVQTTLSGLWSENVLNMTLDRQEESIYKPIRELAYSIATFMNQLVTSPNAALQTFIELLTNGERWFSFGGGIFALLLLLFFSGLFLLSRWLITRLRVLFSQLANNRIRQRRRAIEFYERFVNFMLARGLTRAPTQTQQEFAAQVASAYSPELHSVGIDDAPELISRLFYQVRFGEADLSATDLEQLHDLLNKFEQALSTEANPQQA